MIEPIMFIGIGFLVAGLLVIGVIPLVHARAVRLTIKRVEAMTPMSMAEIQADKDQLRAEFAMSTHRLEMAIEQLKTRTTGQAAEIGKKSEAISRLQIELGEKTAALATLDAKEKQLTDDLRNTAQELATRTATLQETEQSLARAQATIGELTNNFNDTTHASDNQRIELITRGAQIEMLRGKVTTLEAEVQELANRLNFKTVETEAIQRELDGERARAAGLNHSQGELEQQVVAQTTAAEILERRVQELLARTDEHGRLVSESEFTASELRHALAAAAKKEADLRAALAEAESRGQATADALRSEKGQLEELLRQAHAAHTKLKRESEQMRRKLDASWEVERMENAVMRERIDDVAAEVARLTSALEGPGNPIEAILATEASRPHAPSSGAVNGNAAANGNGAANGEFGRGSLAERIRVLQRRAARTPPTTPTPSGT